MDTTLLVRLVPTVHEHAHILSGYLKTTRAGSTSDAPNAVIYSPVVTHTGAACLSLLSKCEAFHFSVTSIIILELLTSESKVIGEITCQQMQREWKQFTFNLGRTDSSTYKV